ncbi:MAG TPA: dienelactone hydrolase family protein [Kineosporiaceae bacterium]
MTDVTPAGAPLGDLSTYDAWSFTSRGVSHPVYRRGDGPAVIVISELPGISRQLLGFADRLVALGCSVALPDLFGGAGSDPLRAGLAEHVGGLGRIARACISREFTVLATGRSSPITGWLRDLARHEHQRCGGPGVGVVGMCFSGGFALAMAVDPVVVAPVLAQPSLPFAVTGARRRSIDCGDADLDAVAERCAGGLRVLGVRFEGDPLAPAERFAFLRERLGDAFLAVELSQQDGHPGEPLPRHHSVLTLGLIDEPGEPTRAALDQVLEFLAARLEPR